MNKYRVTYLDPSTKSPTMVDVVERNESKAADRACEIVGIKRMSICYVRPI